MKVSEIICEKEGGMVVKLLCGMLAFELEVRGGEKTAEQEWKYRAIFEEVPQQQQQQLFRGHPEYLQTSLFILYQPQASPQE